MSTNRNCPYCGSKLSAGDVICPNCGAYVEDVEIESSPKRDAAQEQVITHPKTIEELQKYCSQHGMPLVRMRFFIGEDYKEPRAFGIYQSGSDFIVYKNKDTGDRAIRYEGPDEAYAVNEIFQKLLSECHNRGIYPDGEPQSWEPVSRGYKQKSETDSKKLSIGICGFVLVFAIIACVASVANHKNDGYYEYNGKYYYRYGNDWSYFDSVSDDWYDVYDFPSSSGYESFYVDDSYSSSWGISDVRDSEVWDDWHTSSDTGSSYDSSFDSWDSSGTDWSSDW